MILADCTWDFFGCTNRNGDWPSNKPCCQARFDACCMKVMAGKKKPGQGHFDQKPPETTSSRPEVTTSSSLKPQSPDNRPPPQHQTQNPAEKIQLSKILLKKNIFSFNKIVILTARCQVSRNKFN